MVPTSHPFITGSSTVPWVPAPHPPAKLPPDSTWALQAGEREGDDLAHCLALHGLQLPRWHFPCVQDKNVNKEHVIKPAREGKWQELLKAWSPGVISNAACSCCSCPPSKVMAEADPSLQHYDINPLEGPRSNKALKHCGECSREPPAGGCRSWGFCLQARSYCPLPLLTT